MEETIDENTTVRIGASFFMQVIVITLLYFAITAYSRTFDEVAFYHALKSSSLLGAKLSSIFIALGLFLVQFLGRKHLRLVKSKFPRSLRFMMNGLILVLMWSFSVYEYNFYAGQWHFYDRAWVLCLGLLSLRFPIVSIAFIVQIHIMDYQFNFPLGGSKLLDKSLLLELLKIWGAFHLVALLARIIQNKIGTIKTEKSLAYFRINPNVFYLIALSFYSYFYFLPGLQKVVLGNGFSWPIENDIVYNLLAMRSRGWLNSFPADFQTLHLKYFSVMGNLGQIAIFVLELLALFLMTKKKWFKLFIPSMIIFHLHVFLLNGALFWMWIVGGIVMYKILKVSSLRLFSPRMILFTMCFYLSCYWGIKNSFLAWYDSPLDNFFELEVSTQNGGTKKVSMATLQPYTLHFQYGNILSAVEGKMLNPGFLIFDKNLFHSMLDKDSIDIAKLLDSKGTSHFRPEMGQNLHTFFESFLENECPHPNVNFVLKKIKPPNYWNAHVTDNLPRIASNEINEIKLIHHGVYRNRDGGFIQLWKRTGLTVSRKKE